MASSSSLTRRPLRWIPCTTSRTTGHLLRKRLQCHPERLQDQTSGLRDDVGIVASTGDKMPPIWFPTGYRLTGADYLSF
ncbi:Uncharacterized protein FKW44_020680 [Caligus rogercresseyi]|uniref:Uncharacterized protein n=1 Tax=Caligus rogercresseyi TaxID=217165 RepID=A0A7T8GQA4_CALRO|nr:Uncharacterized protein FKW44_020680 [Caligus rogercresseyi]